MTRRNARHAQPAPAASASQADQFSTAQFTSPANQSVTMPVAKVGSAASSVGRDLGPLATGAVVAVLGGLAVVGVLAVRRYDPLAATGATRSAVEVREVAQPPTPPRSEPAVGGEAAADEQLADDQPEDGSDVDPAGNSNSDRSDETDVGSPLARVDDETTDGSTNASTTVRGASNQRVAEQGSGTDQVVIGSDGSGSGQDGSGSPAPATGAAGVDAGAGSPGATPGGSGAEAATPAADATQTQAPIQPTSPRAVSNPPVPAQQTATPAPVVPQPLPSQPALVAAPVDPVVFEGQVTAVIEWSLGGGAEPSGFVVSWSGGGRSEQETLAANTRKTQLPDLISGTSYSATIISLGPEGSPRPESALSVSFRTLDADVGPPRPAEDVVVSAGPDRLTVSWTSEVDDPGTTGYFVSWGCCGGRVGGKSVFPQNGQASFTIEGLQSGVVYQIDILTLGANFVADPTTSRRVSGTPD